MDDEIFYGFAERKGLDQTWLKKQLRSGASIADIVKLTGYSSYYISKTIKELGLSPLEEKVTSASSPNKKPEVNKKPTKAGIHKQQTQKKEVKTAPTIKERKGIDIEWLKQQLDTGTPIAEIARRARYSRLGVYYNINKHNLNIPKKKGIDPGWLREQKMLGKTDADIAEEFGLDPSSVKYCRKKYGIDSFIVHPPMNLKD
jgi:AraC-like DNA-binding protein